MSRWLRQIPILILCACIFCPAQDLTVAAASDLQFVFPEIAAHFQKDTGHGIKLIFGSSGNFFAQTQNGAPFDLFFSADVDYPKKLAAAGATEPGSLDPYATGKIVVWVTASSKLDLGRGLAALLDPSIKKIAIANPQHAPYGRAAEAALRKTGIYDRVAQKLVLGENISQTASFVASGGADVGVIALSLASAPSMKNKGRYVEIPAADYPAIEQAAVVLRSSSHKALARQLLNYFKTPAIQELMGSYGFGAAPH